MPRYAELIYNGFWFSPEREMLQALIDKSQEHVTGTVRVKLYKGSATTVARWSDHLLIPFWRVLPNSRLPYIKQAHLGQLMICLAMARVSGLIRRLMPKPVLMLDPGLIKITNL